MHISTITRTSLLFVLLAAMAAVVAPRAASAAPSESAPIWRAQITLQTGDISDAGTSNSVYVKLTEPHRTWIDYAPTIVPDAPWYALFRDDFQRGDRFTYDLALEGVKRFSDITTLQIGKVGSDGWCLQSFDLRINGKVIYSKSFSALSNGCHWLDSDDGDSLVYTVGSATLRAANSW